MTGVPPLATIELDPMLASALVGGLALASLSALAFLARSILIEKER